MLFYCIDSRFYQKILQNYGFFLKKNWDIWNSKFQQNSLFTISFLFFQQFWHFVFDFTYPNLSKYYEIFCSVLLERLEILPMFFWKILKFLLKKILICEIILFPKFSGLLFVFLFFYYFWHFIFNFVHLYLSTNSRNFYVFYFMD